MVRDWGHAGGVWMESESRGPGWLRRRGSGRSLAGGSDTSGVPACVGFCRRAYFRMLFSCVRVGIDLRA
jgi:hypothetical protein